MQTYKPTRAEILAAANKTVPDVIAYHLKVLFCGINPGLYTAAIGHHFGRPGNRFWPVLHSAGFTPRIFSPFEERELLDLGCGITNVVPRATATAQEVSFEELRAGGQSLVEKVRRYQPAVLAVLGVTAFRGAFAQPKATIGLQVERIGGVPVCILPNPSGLNAHYQIDGLSDLFRELRLHANRLIS